MGNLNNMNELKIVIPAIIDYCRYSNELQPNALYFFNTLERHNRNISPVDKSVFTLDDIKLLLNKINAVHLFEEIVSGNFIENFNSKNKGLFNLSNNQLREKIFIINILKLVLTNPYFKKEFHSFISCEEDIIKYSERIKLSDVKIFWQTMLDYEIFYLNLNINDLGFWEWNNFGIDIYNTLASTRNKLEIFNEVNKILCYILCPFDSTLAYLRFEELKSSFTIKFSDKILQIKSVEIESRRHKTFQELLNFIYKNFLLRILPIYSYEKKWILENNGCFIRKGNNPVSVSLIDLGIVDGVELTLHILNNP